MDDGQGRKRLPDHAPGRWDGVAHGNVSGSGRATLDPAFARGPAPGAARSPVLDTAGDPAQDDGFGDEDLLLTWSQVRDGNVSDSNVSGGGTSEGGASERGSPEESPAPDPAPDSGPSPSRQQGRPGAGFAAGAVMYEEFYGLSERPFMTLPDPSFLYWSEGHQMAFAVLRYGIISRAPVTVMTGAVGAGKTTLLRRLLAEIPGDITVGLISNMMAGRGELLHWVSLAFDLPFTGTEPHVVLLRQFQDFVIRRYAEGRRVVLIVDEAQNLSLEQIEELRLLSNINADKDELLQLILVGQPKLRELVNHPELVQFAQRISADFDLTPLSTAETVAYIDRRLDVAGASWKIFPDEISRGDPRAACRLR